MKKNNKGAILLNIFLLLLIIICALCIFFVLESNNNEIINISKTNEIKNNKVESFASDNKTRRYYYNQLSDVGKSIYDTLSNNIYLLKKGTQRIDFEIKVPDAGNYVQSALDALFLDRPDIFWIDILKISFSTRKTTFLTSVDYSYYLEPKVGENNYLVDCFKTEYEVEDAINKVENQINSIASRAIGTTYDKVKFVHDKLVNKISYDESLGVNSSNIYGALVDNTCVCEGYAESFKTILDALNIPCIIVYGNGIDSEGNTEAHAWNYVKMDNEKWYAVDTTWDDPIIIGGDDTGLNRHKYFLKGSNDFLYSHKPDGNVSGEGQVFEYPVLSETDY